MAEVTASNSSSEAESCNKLIIDEDKPVVMKDSQTQTPASMYKIPTTEEETDTQDENQSLGRKTKVASFTKAKKKVGRLPARSAKTGRVGRPSAAGRSPKVGRPSGAGRPPKIVIPGKIGRPAKSPKSVRVGRPSGAGRPAKSPKPGKVGRGAGRPANSAKLGSAGRPSKAGKPSKTEKSKAPTFLPPVVNGQPLKPLEKDPNLPAGWKRLIVQRKSGATAGKYDLYLFGPDGRKIRSTLELAAYLREIRSKLSADSFDFTIFGKDNTPKKTKSKSTKQSAKKKQPDTANAKSGEKSNKERRGRKRLGTKTTGGASPKKAKSSTPGKKGRGRPPGSVKKTLPNKGKKAT